ncbi:coiled-coil domain-containing protein 158-like isoform X2 [Sinocyclocheilus anshuiensis]|uniref:coiled-coil domain-containing protein 158-like isoform X2 n=1 Tax=Sinocyclocheilus anshuiensis TaxID=1608454 RepID=UPI0007BA1928|nr:PREDICTED: coiled-coil domain-containing protein 158-like isoform X2 [Sinocyclocheilus anshuiensis]
MTAEADDRVVSAELENALHIISNHSCTVDMQQYFTNQIERLRGENQQLKAALRQAEFRFSTVEREKACQQAALSEKICNVDQLTLEKQQMTAELGVRRMQLTQLKEGQEALKELLGSKTCELEQENLKLKTQLKTLRAELDQANSSLRTLEGADGHGLKVALGMQKQITAKREQIDFLQSRIQLLEETIEKLKMEKHRQALLVKRQTQELLSERESRRRLESEVEALCSQERELKGKAERLEAALYKQEQELMRLKLQHALDIKELQSQNWRNVSRSPVSSCTLQTHLPLAQHNVNGLMEMRVSEPLVELKSLRELRGGIAEEQGPHTTLSFRRRPEEDHKSRQPIGTKGAESTTRPIGRINSYSEPGSFRTAEPNKQDHTSPLSADNNAVSFRAGQTCCSRSVCATGRRSPVHLLLTSDLPTDRNYWLEVERPAYANQISANNQDELTRQASQKIKLDRP